MNCMTMDENSYLNRSLHSFFNKLSESSKENIKTTNDMDSYSKFISEPILHKLCNENLLTNCNGFVASSKFNNQGAFDLMKQLISSDRQINSDSEGNHSILRDTDSPVSIHSSHQTESIASKEDANDNEYNEMNDQSLDNSEKISASVTLDVTETYQLGFRSNSSKKSTPDKVIIHFPLCIEAMKVNYPVSCTNDDLGVPQVPVDYPPILLTKDHRKDLSKFVMQNLTLICNHVDSYYSQLDEDSKAAWIQQQLQCDAEIVFLRMQMFRLLMRLLPDLDVVESFDCTTPDLERLLDCICHALDSNENDIPSNRDRLSMFPLVVLHRDCKHALSALKEKLFQTLCLMLPDLSVPESFSSEADIYDLIECIYSCT